MKILQDIVVLLVIFGFCYLCHAIIEYCRMRFILFLFDLNDMYYSKKLSHLERRKRVDVYKELSLSTLRIISSDYPNWHSRYSEIRDKHIFELKSVNDSVITFQLKQNGKKYRIETRR